MMISAHQVSFLPYLGFFSKIKQADLFVLMDLYQFNKKDKNKFENRNRIRIGAPKNTQWITVPCKNGSDYKKMIDVKIDNSHEWNKKILKAITWNYRSAPYFESHWYKFRQVFRAHHDHLVDLNSEFITLVMDILDVTTPIYVQSVDLPLLFGDSTDKLVSLCKYFDADCFLFGPDGRRYVKKVKFKWSDIGMKFMKYEHPVYKQQYEPFISHMSVLDAIFNCGDKVKEMI